MKPSAEVIEHLLRQAQLQKTTHEMSEEESAGADYEDGYNFTIELLVRPLAEALREAIKERDEARAVTQEQLSAAVAETWETTTPINLNVAERLIRKLGVQIHG